MFRGLGKLKSANPVTTPSEQSQNQAWYENESNQHNPTSQTASIVGGINQHEVPWYKRNSNPLKPQQKRSFRGSRRFSFRKRHFSSSGKLSITSKKAAAKKEASKSTGDLIDTSEGKKKKSRPLSLFLKPPEQVDDWYKSLDTPNGNTKQKLSNPQIFVLAASSPNIDKVAVRASPLPDPPMSNVVPGEVALLAYPPSPYELDMVKNPFTSYLDQVLNENSRSAGYKTGRSQSFSRKPSLALIPPSPLTLSPSTRLFAVSGSTPTSNSEGCDGGGPQTLSFGRNQGRRYLVPTYLTSPNKSPSSLKKPFPNRYERSGGRARCHSLSSTAPFSTKTNSPLTAHKLTPQLVPVRGSIPKSATHTQRLKPSRSFSSRASYSADALDNLDCEYSPKAQSMVNSGYTCEYSPKAQSMVNSGYTCKRSSQHTIFTFPSPFRKGDSERLSSRSQSQRSFGSNTPTFSHARNMTAPSHHRRPVTSTPTYPHTRHTITSAPTHTRTRHPTICSLSYIRSSTTPTHTHSRYVSSPRAAVNKTSLAASSSRCSILSFSAYSDISTTAGSIVDTQSEIWSTGRQCYGNGRNHARPFVPRRGQRAFRSLVFPRRRLSTCMFYYSIDVKCCLVQICYEHKFIYFCLFHTHTHSHTHIHS